MAFVTVGNGDGVSVSGDSIGILSVQFEPDHEAIVSPPSYDVLNPYYIVCNFLTSESWS